MKTTVENREATTAYAAKAADVAATIAKIQRALKEHGAEGITWGSVGDLGYVNASLAEIAEFLGVEA